MAKLSLRALDEADLTVISACLQDALVPAIDLAYLAEERRFVFVASRFLWEGPRGQAPQRVHCGVSVEGVGGVRYRGFARPAGDAILSLLALGRIAGGIELVFSGRAAIRLATDRIELGLRDLDEPWPALAEPSHQTDG